MTRFCGHKTGFNPRGENDILPNPLGPPATKFGGRSCVPTGPLKRFPGAVADISGGNRRLSKSSHGHGGGDGVTYKGSSAFGNMGRGMNTGRKPGGMDGSPKKSMAYNKK